MANEDVKGDEFTTSDEYDVRVKAKAYELYLSSAMTPTDIALSVAVPENVIRGWIRGGRWADRRMEIEVTLLAEAENKYRRLVLENRAPTVERHLTIGKKLEDLIGKLVDATQGKDGEIDMREVNKMANSIDKLAKAWSSATAVTARSAGISDRPFEQRQQQLGGGDDGREPRKPLIVTGSDKPKPALVEDTLSETRTLAQPRPATPEEAR
mgnify:CR=1 FL=1